MTKDKSWVHKSAAEFKYNFLNKGLNGDITSSMLARYDEDVLVFNPKQVFIMGGTNDLLCNRSIDSIIESINLMIKYGTNNNIKVIIGIPPKIIPYMANDLFCPSMFYDSALTKLKDLRNELILLCNNYNIEYVDFYSAIPNSTDLYLDGIHLNEKGNELMFKEFKKGRGLLQ